MANKPSFMETHFAGPSRRRIARQDADIRKQESDLKLKQAGYTPDLNQIPGSPAEVDQKERALQIELMNSLQGKLAAQESDTGMEEFALTGDATNLQKVLDNNMQLKNAWAQRGVQHIANIDWGNDEKMLARIGMKPHEYDTPAKQSVLKKNLYKFYDGQDWNIGMINQAAASTGAVRRLGTRRGGIFADNHEQMRKMMAGPQTSANTAEGHKYEVELSNAAEVTGVPANLLASMMNTPDSPDTAIGILQDAQEMKDLLTRYNGNTRLALAAFKSGSEEVDRVGDIPPNQRTQQFVGQVLNNFAVGEEYYNEAAEPIKSFDISGDIRQEERLADNRIATIQSFYREQAALKQGKTAADIAKVVTQKDVELDLRAKEIQAKNVANAIKLKTEGTTTKQKDLVAAEQFTNTMLDDFGGEEEFWKIDFSQTVNFNKAWPNVVKINKLQDTKFSEADKKSITEMRELIDLADPAIQLTESQVGILDKTIENVKKHINKNAKGIDAIAAIEAFRNTLRHSLFGSALTAGEIESFNAAYGSNRQGLAAVLKQFRVSLRQVKTKLESQMTLGNPYTNRVILGADKDRMDKVMSALQERIDFAEGIKPGSRQEKQSPISATIK